MSKNPDAINYADTLMDYLIQEQPDVIDSIRKKISSGKSGDVGRNELLKVLKILLKYQALFTKTIKVAKI